MASAEQWLIDRDHRLILLLTPPFDRAEPNPGYIKGYVPGVRENGGQYTHAAIWATMAFAHRGDADKAWELLRMINPVNHGSTREDIATYKVEPYVVAADVYSVAPHTGRGGWSWYTGSARWLYRLAVASLPGLRLPTPRDGRRRRGRAAPGEVRRPPPAGGGAPPPRPSCPNAAARSRTPVRRCGRPCRASPPAPPPASSSPRRARSRSCRPSSGRGRARRTRWRRRSGGGRRGRRAPCCGACRSAATRPPAAAAAPDFCNEGVPG